MPNQQIIYQQPTQKDVQAIDLEKLRKMHIQRRRNHAKRLLKRFPLFGVEFMQERYDLKGYGWYDFLEDSKRRTKKRKGNRKKKSPLIRQGRYPLMQKALSQYRLTGEVEHLQKAQKLRNLLYYPWRIQYKLNGVAKDYFFPSTYSYILIKKLASIQFKNWKELEEKQEPMLRYAHTG